VVALKYTDVSGVLSASIIRALIRPKPCDVITFACTHRGDMADQRLNYGNGKKTGKGVKDVMHWALCVCVL
jgi:hypothetical protein